MCPKQLEVEEVGEVLRLLLSRGEIVSLNRNQLINQALNGGRNLDGG